LFVELMWQVCGMRELTWVQVISRRVARSGLARQCSGTKLVEIVGTKLVEIVRGDTIDPGPGVRASNRLISWQLPRHG
jgi:hypothetical protein